MPKPRSLRAAHVVTRSIRPAPYSCAERLPAELVTQMLEYLGQGDLWRAAAVSRTFYASAWYAGLYIHRKLWWYNASNFDIDVAVLHEVVQHALRHDLRLSISFDSLARVNSDLTTPNSSYELMSTVLAEVTTALPVLVFLSLSLDESFCHSVDDALRHPAPRLHEICLAFCADMGLGGHVVPLDLFSGFAPQLRRVTLTDVLLGTEPVLALSRVTYLDLCYEYDFPDVNISFHFPSVRSLHLACSAEPASEPPCFKLDGISLRNLVIEDHEQSFLVHSVDRATKLCDIPIIEHIADDVVWTEPIWQQNTDEMLSIRFVQPKEPDSDMSIHIVPERRNWRRTCHLRWWDVTYKCAIVDMPGIRNRLTYLRMDNDCLMSFLHGVGLTLHALRNLQVDLKAGGKRAEMLWPPDWLQTLQDWEYDAYHGWDDRSAETFGSFWGHNYVRCENLETMTLFALDAVVWVSSREAAFLGHALSSDIQRETEGMVLSLIGVEFKAPVADQLVAQAFSSVRRFEFCGKNSPADKDGGLWDEVI